MFEFKDVLQAVTTPIVLISGIGLILLSAVNRYNQALSRTRQLIGECNKENLLCKKENTKKQVDILMKRCNLLKYCIAFLLASVVSSSVIIFNSALSVIFKINISWFSTGLLLLGIVFIIVSNVLLLTDVFLSLKALEIERENLEK